MQHSIPNWLSFPFCSYVWTVSSFLQPTLWLTHTELRCTQPVGSDFHCPRSFPFLQPQEAASQWTSHSQLFNCKSGAVFPMRFLCACSCVFNRPSSSICRQLAQKLQVLYRKRQQPDDTVARKKLKEVSPRGTSAACSSKQINSTCRRVERGAISRIGQSFLDSILGLAHLVARRTRFEHRQK